MNKPGTFPQGTQRIARIAEVSEPNTYVLEPAAEATATSEPAPAATTPLVHTPLTDAELASAFVGERGAPVVVRRVKRVTSAYTAEVADERPEVTVV